MMNRNSDWQQVAQIFARALEEPTGGRDAFLDRHCGENTGLRRMVISLLAADAQPDGLLDGHAADAVGLADLALRSDERIGAYRIVRAIGAGGMGSVYLAERVDGEFDQTVALKLVNAGRNTAELARRLRAERQILAGLEHPAIARLIDGGVIEDGRPYFTMEYVDGTPIDEYCARNQLSPGARLKLFSQVLQAVAYAQQNLVVHRDLKPSNILVSSAGEVKLLDFGIAKVLAEDAQDQEATRTVMRAMTPQYAAPEQVRGEPVTTATDIYALGLILFQLLSGNRPYVLTKGTPDELERLICNEVPPLMSRVVTADDTRIVEHFGVTGARLRRQLAGDLDTICAKALRKEPTRRYRSAQQMLDDLERHRAGFPVRARPDAFWYRTRKFAQRNQRPLLVALIAVLAIAGLLGFYTAQLANERDRARREANKSAAISDFLGSLLQNADPTQTRGAKLTVREVLDTSAERIDDELKEQPYVRASILNVIGTVYEQLGQLDDAERILTEALSIRLRLYEQHPDLATSLYNLASTKSERGATEEARELYQQSLDMREAVLGPDSPEVVETLTGLAGELYTQSDLDGTERLLRRAIEIGKRVPDADLTSPMNLLGILLHARHDYAGSASLYLQVLDQLQQKNPRSPLAVSARHNLAQVLMDQNRLDEAEKLAREAVALAHDIYGDDHHPSEVVMLMGLGRILVKAHRYEQAERIFHEALAFVEEVQGDRHPRIFSAKFALCMVYYDSGNYSEADRMCRESIEASVAHYGPTSRDNVLRSQHHGKVLRALGRHREAEAAQRAALTAIESLSGPTHRRAIRAASGLAHTLADMGRLDEALALQTQTVARELKSWGDGHRYHLLEVRLLAELLRRAQRYDEAETLARRVVRDLPDHYRDNHPERATALHILARILHDRQSHEEAASLYQRAIDIRRQAGLEEHPELAMALLGLAELRLTAGDAPAAESLLRESVAILDKRLPEAHPHRVAAHRALERSLTARSASKPSH